MNAARQAAEVLSSWAPRIDKALASALTDQYRAMALPQYHLKGAIEDSLSLGDGGDCCYDRPGIGMAYAAWYQPRRVHQWVRRLLPAMAGREKPLRLVDLGAGTGAVLWAASLIQASLRVIGVTGPESLAVVGIDASPDMVTTGQLLWTALSAAFPEIDVDAVQTEWHTLTWPEAVQVGPKPGCWVLAGHLFDASQATAPDEAAALVSRTVMKLGAEMLWLAVPIAKYRVLERTVAGLVPLGWYKIDYLELSETLWSGTLSSVGDWRREVGAAAAVGTGLRRPPTWADDYTVTRVLRHRGTAGPQLFTPELQGLALDQLQDEIASPTNRMTLIVGAAGSGKSTVLIERVARTVEAPVRGRGPTKALVTTFNIDMIDRLARWYAERLVDRPGGVKRAGSSGDWTFTLPDGAMTHSVRFLNWDKVPPRVFGVTTPASGLSDVLPGKMHLMSLNGWAARIKQHGGITGHEFLAAELRRVIFGLGATTEDLYLAVERRGRAAALQEDERRLAWHTLMENPVPYTFDHRWIEVLKMHRSEVTNGETIRVNDASPLFTHAFIDECQDFTPSDFAIAACLVPDANRLTATGDGAQAIHLASCFKIPRTIRGRRWVAHDLRLSYRMPARLAEAVAPLAQQLAANSNRSGGRESEASVGIPSGTVLGVLGCRPVVVADGVGLDDDLRDVFARYEGVWNSRTNRICIAEGSANPSFKARLRGVLPQDAVVSNEYMRKIKGLERDCVVWHTSAAWAADDAAAEFVYTVLTRSRRLAVIVIDPENTRDDIGHAVSTLRRDRLLFWNAAAEQAFDAFA